MIKTKIFDDEDELLLEKRINDWLEENRGISIIDIKFYTSSMYSVEYGEIYNFSAMVVYKEETK